MSTAAWFLMIGGLLLLVGMRYPLIRRLPLTPSIMYLAVGILVGPSVLDAFHFDPLKQYHWLEIITEIAVLLSLFNAGIKMPVPLQWALMRGPVRLAFLSMALSVALTAGFAYWVLQLPLGAAILIGAVLAPTDPVLATDVQVRHMGDENPLRVTLTGEAGMNDGSAFPFIMLGLGLMHWPPEAGFFQHWVLKDVLWSTLSAIGLGAALGTALAYLVWEERKLRRTDHLMDDFLGMGLIAVVYGISLMVDAWGFIAVFFAAVMLRQTELNLTGQAPGKPDASAGRFPARTPGTRGAMPRISEGSLVFKDPLERLSEVVLVLLLGGMLFVDSWSWRAVAMAAFLFLVARPVSVFLGLLGTDAPYRLRALVGWFGIRGIGSLYYLMFAVAHGVPEELALELIHITLIVVTLSILVHGVTVKPVISRFTARDSPP